MSFAHAHTLKDFRFPIHSLYEVIMFIITIGLAAFIWWALSLTYTPIAGVGSQMIQDLGTNSTLSDASETFFANMKTYLLVLVLVIGSIWTFIYSQRRGREIAY